jgi:acyl-CoA dehydrogenase
MDFALSDKMQDLLARVDQLLVDVVMPLEKPWMARGFNAIEPELNAAREKVKAAGLFAPQVPTDVGGQGFDLVEHGLLSAALGRSPLGHYIFGCQAPDAGNIEVLHMHGTDEQKTTWLLPLVAGEVRSCFSMTEPNNPGSNPVLLSTTAELDGDDWVINGHKWFSTAADGAKVAIVMAVTEPDAAPHQRASMLVVPTETPGFELVRNIPIMGHAGSGWASHGEVKLTDCRVPKRALLGQRGAGFAIAQERLGPGRIHHCMRWIGIGERSLQMMIDRALMRDLGKGRLAEMQTIQNWIAEGRAKLNAARMSVLHAAWTIERDGFKAARVDISCIKFLVAEIMLEIVDRAIQTHGALGITDDTVLSFFYAHERGARIYDGPDEVHKSVVSRSLVKARARELGHAL